MTNFIRFQLISGSRVMVYLKLLNLILSLLIYKLRQNIIQVPLPYEKLSFYYPFGHFVVCSGTI